MEIVDLRHTAMVQPQKYVEQECAVLVVFVLIRNWYNEVTNEPLGNSGTSSETNI